MTRRPASRRPPRLTDTPIEASDAQQSARASSPTSLRELVTRTGVTGRHRKIGRAELTGIMRRLRDGDRPTWWGFDPVIGLGLDEIGDVAEAVWGLRFTSHRCVLDPDVTGARLRMGIERIEAVAAAGGRIAFATGRPASLLSLYQALARRAGRAGANVLASAQSSSFMAGKHGARRLWWLEGVAVMTDGDDLLSGRAIEAGEELLFWLPRPDLVVADSGFASCAVGAGIPTVAIADLDQLALGWAQRRGDPVTIVPVDVACPPQAYALLLQWAEMFV